MHFFYIAIISLANNLDNIGVRIAYSLRGINIGIHKNLWISVITFFISTAAAFTGSTISGYLSNRLSSWLSMFLLVAIGLWIIIGDKFKKEKNNIASPKDNRTKNIFVILDKPEYADLDNSKEIDFKEATLLGVALSLNNIGGGLSAGMIGLNSYYVGLLSAVISFLALFTGNYLSKFFQRLNLGKKATIASGIILILIGVKQLL